MDSDYKSLAAGNHDDDDVQPIKDPAICPKCGNIGCLGIDENNTVIPCDCPAGKKWKRQREPGEEG